MYWENKGKLVPTRDLIKTPEQIEGIRRAGVINTGVLDAVAAAIHPGMNTQEIDDICMEYCKEHDAIPACLNYEGFPKSVCTSKRIALASTTSSKLPLSLSRKTELTACQLIEFVDELLAVIP